MSPKDNNSFTYFFPIWITFISSLSILCQIALARMSIYCLVEMAKVDMLELFLILGEKFKCFTIEFDIGCVGFS